MTKLTRKQRLFKAYIENCFKSGNVHDVCTYETWCGYWRDDKEELKRMMDELPEE